MSDSSVWDLVTRGGDMYKGQKLEKRVSGVGASAVGTTAQSVMT